MVEKQGTSVEEVRRERMFDKRKSYLGTIGSVVLFWQQGARGSCLEKNTPVNELSSTVHVQAPGSERKQIQI